MNVFWNRERWERERGGTTVNHRGRGRGGKEKESMQIRSPGQLSEIEGIRKRLDGEEEDLGTILGTINNVMKREMESVVGNTPMDMQAVMKEGMMIMNKAVQGIMEKITERDKREEEKRKEREGKLQEQIEKLEGKIKVLEEKVYVGSSVLEDSVKLMEEKLEGGMTKLNGIEEQVEDVKGGVEKLSEVALGIKVGESVREMEEKVKETRCALKLVNMDIGQETGNKALIVRKILEEVRRKVRQEEAGQVNRVLRRTRVVILGKGTEGRKVGERKIWTVPVLFQCVDIKDANDLEWSLRRGGFFPTVHWPEEIMEFINGIKSKVREESAGQDNWIRVRPVVVDGQARIRVDLRPRGGGIFRQRGVWVCPPLEKIHWSEVKGLYDPIWG